MLKKLRLNQGDNYQRNVATFEIAMMLIDFVNGRKHYLCIGSEQGELIKWDDILIKKEQDSFIHIQVKRQTSDFGNKNDECQRNLYTQGARINQKRNLSPLDELMKDLADWSRNIDLTKMNPKREFWIELPEGSPQIKMGLKVKHLKDLCENHIKPAVTKSKDLEKLASTDSNIKNCFIWLTSWCDFNNWDHILKALQFLKIKTEGTDSLIIEKTEKLIKEIFITNKTKEVRLKILSYTIKNSAFSSAISPRNLLFELKDYLHQNIATWTQFEKVDSHWNISGIHDLEFNDIIERPSIIVPSLWNNDRSRYLKIKAPVNDSCKLSESLMRLVVHQDGLVHTHCEDKIGWVNSIKCKVGGTIGIGANDLDNLSVVENTEVFSTSDNKTLKSRSEHESISKELHTEMLAKTWILVVKNIEKKLDEMESSELRNAVETRWKSWRPQLEKPTKEQRNLFLSMLHPNAEGENICGELRIGAKTTSLLVDGLFLLLIVAVCLDEDNEGDWKNITSSFSVNTIGLCFWSGPMGKKRKVREITDNGIEELIGKETADILIISKTDATAGDIYNNDLTGDDFYSVSLASSNYPKLLVTNHIKLKRMIKKGKIIPLTKYLNSFIEKSNHSKQVAIQRAIS